MRTADVEGVVDADTGRGSAVGTAPGRLGERPHAASDSDRAAVTAAPRTSRRLARPPVEHGPAILPKLPPLPLAATLTTRDHGGMPYQEELGSDLRTRRRSVGLMLAVASALVIALAPGARAESSLSKPPPGANNFGCKPSAAHPNPLVLVHGLGATMGENWSYLSPLLAARGYCVFALTYGLDPRMPYFGGVIPMEQSAEELGAFVKQVLAATGTSKVDLVGHSEGTFMPEYWLKFLGGAAKVNKYVALAPLYAGTNLLGFATLASLGAPSGLSGRLIGFESGFCGSCAEFLAGSAMVQKINSGPGGAAVPGVTYTTVMSRYDELVVPYTSGYLHASNATNVIVQDVCANDVSEHALLAIDPVVAQIVFNALDPAHRQPVSCAGLPPLAPKP